jgi:Ulp1 family protease
MIKNSLKSAAKSNFSQKKLVAQRYGKEITQNEMENLRVKSVLSENMLNFFIRYLEERQ